MLETPHVVVGAAIASKIPNPLIAIPLAFASHFVLELVPHWNPHINTELKKYGKVTTRSTQIIVFDVLTSIFAGSFIAYQALPNQAQALTILAASFAAVLPDVVEAPYFFMGYKSKVLKFWMKTQKAIQNDTTVFYGLITQTLTVIAAFWWIFRS